MIQLEKLNQQQFQEILMNIYILGNETKCMKVKELIEEIQRQVSTCIYRIYSSN